MHLKKLELLGFKSFADRTELSFQPGMTAVVGPNGCGKSNVVDAFKWIFGEQSAKGLRGSEMKDVIFNGTQTRKPAGYAEVTIVFDNEDRYLDIDYSEVAVTRRLYRSSESEYLINKQRCRLKDIKQLFIGTGIGQTSYSIFEQGKIDVLLQASHLDRRIILEEAAGISKYRIKREETLRALARVQDNLLRLNDIIDEVEKRITRVKAQASKARRYRRISDRLKSLRLRLAVDEYRDSVLASSDTGFRLYFSEFRLTRIDGLLDDLRASLERRTSERQANQGRLRELREGLEIERMSMERTRERIDNGERRIRDLVEEETTREQDLESTKKAIESLHAELEAEEKELETVRDDIERRQGEIERFTAERDEVRRQQERCEDELREKKEETVRLIQKRSRVGNAMAHLDAEIRNLHARQERLATSLSGFQTLLETEQHKEKTQVENVENLGQEALELQRGREALDREVVALEVEVSDFEEQLADIRKKLHQRVSRCEVLESLEEKLEGVSRGVVEILKRAKEEAGEAPESPFRQVHGMVAALVKVDSRYATAVESALGAMAEALVVETQEGGLGIIDRVREEELGGLEVACLDRVNSVPLEQFPRQGGVLGALGEFVETEPGFEDLLDRLLANVVLVEDLKTAIALSRNGLRSFRLVTLHGEVVEPWGGLSVTGENERGVLSRRSELDDLREQIAGLAENEQSRAQVLRERRECLVAKRADAARSREKEAAISRSMVEVEGLVLQTRREMDRLQREIHVGASEVAELETDLARRASEKSDLEKESELLGQEETECETEVARLQEKLSEVSGRLHEAQETVTQSRLSKVQVEKREEALRDILDRQARNLEERGEHQLSLKQRLEALTSRQTEAKEDLDSSRGELEQILERERTLGGILNAEERADAELVEHERAIRQEIDNLRREHERVREDRESAHLRTQEEKHRRNHLVERMEEEYGIDLVKFLEEGEPVEAEEDKGDGSVEGSAEPSTDAPAASSAAQAKGSAAPEAPEEAEEWDREVARKEIKELQEKLRRIGSVNLEALEELDELQERYVFQREQRDDLDGSERHLRGIINELNTTCRELFLTTFAQVQKNFSDLFRKCFGGGKAELVLEQEADVLDAGVEIVARPPGKKITSLSLMSGGEKTMTTLALLFAISRTKPSPFCILDEVDAPLDEPNVRRFGVLLQEFVSQTQFIVITHNKITMTEASTLYGVTMQERGVSTRVAVELENFDPDQLEELEKIQV